MSTDPNSPVVAGESGHRSALTTNLMKWCIPLAVLALFLAIALIIGSGSEIVSAPSDHDDAFYVKKSVSLFGAWSDLATLKEIGSPLFFAAVRAVHVPLRLAFSLFYAGALFLLWFELRRWPFPSWASLAGTLLPLFMPSQFLVFMRPTADPLAVILSVCLLVSCLALYRSSASWASTVCAGGVAAMIWLNRPEGILGVCSVVFVLLFMAVTKGWIYSLRHLRKLVLRLAAVLAILGGTMAGITVLNGMFYQLPAATMMKVGPFVRALNLLTSIEDGQPAISGRPVSKRALELAFQASPTMALSRSFWTGHTDGRGWSGANFPEYSPSDGSVGGGHFHFAFRDSAAAVVGTNVKAELRFFQNIAEELEAAMRSGVLPRRSVPGNELGPSFSIFQRRFWESILQTGKLMFNGQGPVMQMRDTAPTGQNDLYDFACTRRSSMHPGDEYCVRGWIVLKDPPGVPEAMAPKNPPTGSSFKILGRPDVPRVLFALDLSPANCGFEWQVPADAVGKMNLAVSGNGHTEYFTATDFTEARGPDIVRGPMRIHLDAADYRSSGNAPRKWVLMNSAGERLSQMMLGAAIFAVCAGFLCLCDRSGANDRRVIRKALVTFTFICASIVLPRWFLLAAIAANRFPTVECRLQMPGSVVAWVWVITVIGVAIQLLISAVRKTGRGLKE